LTTGSASYIRNLNRKRLLAEIIKNVSISRSELAKITGLNKATVSSQINDLIASNLVVELKREKSSVGRRPIPLQINGNAAYTIGVDIDHNHINIIFVNLKGKIIFSDKLQLKDYTIDFVLDEITQYITPLIKKYNKEYNTIGLAGVGIGIHGIVNNEHKIIFTPKHQWSTIKIKDKLEKALNTKVYIDNNANLSAVCEHAYVNQMKDLFCITLHSGIGLGIIKNNEIYRGYQGFAGEIGHMIIQPKGKQCSCGNKGCWELYASEQVLADKYNINVEQLYTANLLNTSHELQQELDEYLYYIAIGLNNIINIFNPRNIILSSNIFYKNSELLKIVKNKLKSKMNNYKSIQLSKIGYDACALGGAILAIKKYLDVNVLNYAQYKYWE